MTEPEEGTWRVRTGVGLLADAPMSAERRAAFDKEAEKQAKALELEEQLRSELTAERRWELERQGVVPTSVAERLAAASVQGDRDDRIAARKEREAAEALGKPPPRFDRWEAKKNVAAYEAEKESTPTSLGDLGRLEQEVTSLKSKLHSVLKRRGSRTSVVPSPPGRPVGRTCHRSTGRAA
jgi:hypothetical protein